jgi:DNA-binding LacI/PurR family transcriptional regulator
MKRGKPAGGPVDRGDAPAGAPAPIPGATARASRLQMSDIARLAGTSTSTVSRALNHSPLINESTRSRIIELARSLNYSINVGAKNLRRRENSTIGVVIPADVTARQPISDPFFLSMVGSIADAVTDRGMDMLLSRVDSEHLDSVSSLFDSGRAMGILMIGQWLHHDQLNQLAVRNVPIVTWGAHVANALYPIVGSDNTKGGSLATRHLLDQGCERIVFLGNFELPEVRLRHDGYLRSLRAARVPAHPELSVPSPFQAVAAREAILDLAHRGIRYDGIFAASDVLAMAAISTLAEIGLRVPADVAVVGFDDIPAAAYFHPPLTTVHQAVDEAGRQLVECLLRRVENLPVDPVVLPTNLVVRGTSGRPG